MFSGNPDGITRTSTFTVAAMLGDKQITDPEKLLFTKVRFIYSNFREWLNKPTVVATLNHGDEKDDNILLKNFSNINGSANCMILPVFFIFDFEVIVNYIVIKIPNVGVVGVIRFYSG
ncbi:MAG: hypothetical protein COA77_07390 [Thaumarchaeota archaeon]|nr:MAG: hypothetical protein COA77_07390 [Nitrososphaerota archaeon]